MDKEIIKKLSGKFIKLTNHEDFTTIKSMENLLRKFLIQNYTQLDKSYFKTSDFEKQKYKIHSAICTKEINKSDKRELEIQKLVKFLMKKYKDDDSGYSKTDIGGNIVSELEENYDYVLSAEESKDVVNLAWDLYKT